MIDSLRQPLSLGPVNLPLIIIPLLLAWIMYQVLIKRFYSGRKELLQSADRVMFNGLFIILIVWKFSPLVFQFSTVIKNPIAALYLPGGIAGVIMGIAAALIYILVMVQKLKETRVALLKSIGLNLGILLILAAVFSIGTGLLAGSMDEGVSGVAEAAPGMDAPVFTLEAEDGKSYSLSDYTGKTVVLNFWASWCPPCRAELPELKSFYDELDFGKTVFLSINLYTSERNPAGLPDFIREEGLPFPVLYDRSGQTSADYGVESIPTTVIISPDGEISAVKTGAVTDTWLKRAVK
jgi:peroxiredoxin